jgi:hypothetical protein
MSTCSQCQNQFEVTTQDLDFYNKISPVFNGKKYPISTPQLCSDCRHQRHFAFRNERKFYQRKCDLTGKPILSIYAPDMPYKVYDQADWWSDKWDAITYGRAGFDFSKTLSEQLQSLYVDVPHASLYNTNVENSYYTNYALNQKNCYLIFGAGNNEDCMHGKFVVYCKDCVDVLSVYSCELCYEGIASERCYGCRFFVNCRGCYDCTVVEDCSSCNDCICCFGLRTKQYCVFNKQYSKEEFEKFKREYEYLTPEKIEFLKREMNKMKAVLPHVQSHIYSSENCTGDSIYNCKNCFNAFDAKDCEDCKNIYFAPKTIMTQDCSFCAPDGNRFCYNVCSTVSLESAMACFFVWHGSNIYYSIDCHNCNNIFGCVGLRNKNYCILNKQYSPEQYEVIVGRIIEHMMKAGEWGEYFPYSLSPFAYNETIAQEYFPLNREQVLALGGRWREEQLPDIERIADSGNQTLKCTISGRGYKIVPQELNFYKKMKLPIPLVCPDERHYARLKSHNDYKLLDSKCAKCGKDIKTTCRAEIVYCEECYLREVY